MGERERGMNKDSDNAISLMKCMYFDSCPVEG